jgi:hypothetical protein
MSPTTRTLAALIGLGVGFGQSPEAPAQTTGTGSNLSTGSGAGTTPGTNPGSSPSSTRAGTNPLNLPTMPFPDYTPGTPRFGPNRGPQGRGIPPRVPGERNVRMPPGMPDDPTQALYPDLPDLLQSRPGSMSAEDLRALDRQILPEARLVIDPSQRALALERAARVKISNHELDDARKALAEAAEAALQVTDQTVHDSRLIGIVTTSLTLADEEVREVILDETLIDVSSTRPPRTLAERLRWADLAEDQWRRDLVIGRQIQSANFRSEMLYRVVEGRSRSSMTIANEVLRAPEPRSDLQGMQTALNGRADAILAEAERVAWAIQRPVWRDTGLVRICGSAATSDQYRRGLDVARKIPQPEYRTDGLILLAEGQARHGDQAAASIAYQEAARAVAAIPLEDPRGVLANVLIDSLLAVGRFDDARASVGLYPDNDSRLEALGAVAEEQGERGLANSALVWIERDVAAPYRDLLRRRLNDGVQRLLEKTRSAEQFELNHATPEPAPTR